MKRRLLFEDGVVTVSVPYPIAREGTEESPSDSPPVYNLDTAFSLRSSIPPAFASIGSAEIALGLFSSRRLRMPTSTTRAIPATT